MHQYPARDRYRRVRFRPGPETTILAVLALTLVLAGVLAIQAHRSAGSHRQAAEGALRDYAAFAGWELERRLVHSLTGALRTVLARAHVPIMMDAVPQWRPDSNTVHQTRIPFLMRTVPDEMPGNRAPNLPLFEEAVRQELARFGSGHAATEFFRIDLAQDKPDPQPLDLSPTLRAALADGFELVKRELLADPGAPQVLLRGPPDPAVGMQRIAGPFLSPVVVRPFDGSATRVVFTYLPGAPGTREFAYGFVLDVAGLARPIMRASVHDAPLLPKSLTGEMAVDEVLALNIRMAEGDTLYRTDGVMPLQARVVDTLHSELATIITEIAVRPEIARSLVIGGLPPSRMPLLLSLFVVTLGLATVAGAQLRRLRTLNRMRSDFVSGVSHELRTPLAQIQLFAELLGTGRLRRDQWQRSVRVIGEESRRLAYLVENVLHFSGTERHAIRITPEPTDMTRLIRDVVDSFVPLARSRGVTPVLELQEVLQASVDRRAFRQVLLNLLDNAVKYGPPGQRVEIAMTSVDGRLVVSVSDEGPGVPPEERERIWHPYFRLRRDVESATGGSGIGLSVVRELVEMHRGRTAIRENTGGGAVFEISLPAAEIISAEEPVNEPERTIPGAAE